MFRKLALIFFLSMFLGITATHAATTVVTPGIGTLKTAVDAAAEGDILLLQTGNYNLNANINVAVGITIRPEDNTHQPRIILNNYNILLNHTAGSTTLQKLEVIGAGQVYTSNAKAINILENNFTDTRLNFYNISSFCYFIGNHAQRSAGATSGFDVTLGASCYVAGNTFEKTHTFTTYSGYFIGNKVSTSHAQNVAMNLYTAYVIGNEFIRDLDTNPPTYANSDYNLAVFNAPTQSGLTGKWPLISNNIFRVIGALGSAPGSPIKDMVAVNLATSSQLHNNIIDYAAFQWSTGGDHGMIYVGSNSTVQGNIVINGSNNGMPAITFINDTERTQSDASYNDCFNNAGNCGSTDGNISIDPDFVDFIDYVLSPGSSPAIDAGPANEHLNDLDGSRNDMGVHGGPHPISQYRNQLNPAATAPFVYPVFKDIQTLSGAQVEVTAIGVARFK